MYLRTVSPGKLDHGSQHVLSRGHDLHSAAVRVSPERIKLHSCTRYNIHVHERVNLLFRLIERMSWRSRSSLVERLVYKKVYNESV